MQISPSERLQYRLFDVSASSKTPLDKEEVFQIDQDPEVMRYITGGKVTTRTSLNEVFIPRILSYTEVNKGYGMWRVSLLNQTDCIGEVIARPMHFASSSPHYHDIELGWRFKKVYWGKGFATEAARHIMSILSVHPEVSYFSAIVDTHNTASINVMRKLGMQFIHHGIHKDPLGDIEVDLYRFALNRRS